MFPKTVNHEFVYNSYKEQIRLKGVYLVQTVKGESSTNFKFKISNEYGSATSWVLDIWGVILLFINLAI